MGLDLQLMRGGGSLTAPETWRVQVCIVPPAWYSIVGIVKVC